MLIVFSGQSGASRRPDDTVTASSHGATVPSTNCLAAAIDAAKIAATASAQPVAPGSGITGSGSNARNSPVNTDRTGSTRPANRRSQPRTVSAGRPKLAAIVRNATPCAFAASATPITSAVSARRSSATTGNNT